MSRIKEVTSLPEESVYRTPSREEDEEEGRKSVERYQFLAEKLPLMIWTAGPDGKMTYANSCLREFCGSRMDADSDQWPAMIVHPNDIQRCAPLWTASLQEGKAYEVELRIRRADDVYRWCITRAAPQKDALGRVLAWFGVTIDVHELKLAALRNSSASSV